MPVINLGVMDIPYADDMGKPIEGRVDAETGELSTTGQVAIDLEERYGIMKFFIDSHGQQLADEAIQTLLDKWSGMSKNSEELSFLSEAEELFRRMIESKELDNEVGGVPTKASLIGKSLRFKRQYGPPRPSFIDSGLYLANFHAWVKS